MSSFEGNHIQLPHDVLNLRGTQYMYPESLALREQGQGRGGRVLQLPHGNVVSP